MFGDGHDASLLKMDAGWIPECAQLPLLPTVRESARLCGARADTRDEVISIWYSMEERVGVRVSERESAECHSHPTDRQSGSSGNQMKVRQSLALKLPSSPSRASLADDDDRSVFTLRLRESGKVHIRLVE